MQNERARVLLVFFGIGILMVAVGFWDLWEKDWKYQNSPECKAAKEQLAAIKVNFTYALVDRAFAGFRAEQEVVRYCKRS